MPTAAKKLEGAKFSFRASTGNAALADTLMSDFWFVVLSHQVCGNLLQQNRK
jgi:hypothetical protein